MRHAHSRAVPRTVAVLLLTAGLALLIFPVFAVRVNAATPSANLGAYNITSFGPIKDAAVTTINASPLTQLFANARNLLPGEGLQASVDIINDTGRAQNLTMIIDNFNETNDLAEALWLNVVLDKDNAPSALYDDYIRNVPDTATNVVTLLDKGSFRAGATAKLIFTVVFANPGDMGVTLNGNDWFDKNPMNKFQDGTTNFRVRFITGEIPVEPTPGPTPETTTGTPPTAAPGPGEDIIPTRNPVYTAAPTAAPTAPPETLVITEAGVPLATPAPATTHQTSTAKATESQEEIIITETSVPLGNATTEVPATMRKNPKTGEADPAGFVIPGMGFIFAGSCALVLTNRAGKSDRKKKEQPK